MKREALLTWTGAFGARAAGAAGGHYALAVPQDARRALALGWLVLGLAALVGSGVFSILLVLARTPGLGGLFPVADFFHVALVVHVDLSVLVWFIAFAGMLWTINSSARLAGLAWAALIMAIAGAAIIAAAPPVMSNYVPVLDDALFLAGLLVFGCGFLLLTLRGMLAPLPIGLPLDGAGALRFGLNAAVVSGAIACMALAWSWIETPAMPVAKPYYEMLFWGSGHVLQFTWTLLMLVAWLWLASLSGARLPLSPRVAVLLFAVALASVFVVPLIYLAWPVASSEHNRMLTWLMRFGGGIAILPVALAVAVGLARGVPVAPDARPLRAALVASMALFSLGGAIGFLIQGSDVRIPAHYHGAIVGVTLALMGLAYALLPQFGYALPRPRLAAWQPVLYGGGQLLHIVGLVWSGGYGVQRKVAGASQVLKSTSEIFGMGLMGAGGLIAIIGGLLFLVIMFQAMRAGTARGTGR
ncbi:MAG: cbb3-type cytochrome c oxidase subunit I [Betaproteobacteria bacterium]|nr:cbb3-type cytochrome c oxidase subunit I [Betaproteobacteria bacterium]